MPVRAGVGQARARRGGRYCGNCLDNSAFNPRGLAPVRLLDLLVGRSLEDGGGLVLLGAHRDFGGGGGRVEGWLVRDAAMLQASDAGLGHNESKIVLEEPFSQARKGMRPDPIRLNG